MSDINGKVNNIQNIKGSVSSTKNLSGVVGINVGATPDIRIGTISTLETGQEAYVELDSNSTRLNPIFNFGIPKGKSGEDGVDGQNGYTPVKGVDYFTEEDIISLNIVLKEYVDDAISNAQLGGDVNLSNYYTKEEVDNKIPNLEDYALKSDIPSLEDYALKTEIPDVSAYQTEEQVAALIDEAIGGIENGSY